MAYEIKWSDPAQDEIHEIINYLLEEWGDKVAEQLSEQILEISELLANHPYAGRRHEILKAVREFKALLFVILYCN
jgi:plasmid stabilization system protein ParE